MLPEELVEPELPWLLNPPGDSAPPVAEPRPAMPKWENTSCRQLGCVRSVFGSNVGADSNLLASPLNTKLGCWALELEVEEACAPAEEGRNSIQGTATCLPLPLELDELDELMPVLLEVLLGFDDVEPVAPVAPLPDSEITAHSTLPEAGLMMVSLIVPSWVPEELVTSAPVNWLPRTGW